MIRLVIDRFEGIYAICEDKDHNYFAIVREDVPYGAKEGSVLDFSDTGDVTLNEEETERRRQLMAEKQRRMFGL